MLVQIRHEVPAYQSYAAERTRGLYNVDVEDGQKFELDVDVPVERDDWQIGVIVGPSGSGKTSIAKELVRDDWVNADTLLGGMWGEAPVIEELSKVSASYAKATAALAATGLGSVPSWLRPHRVLSNGEQFRANLAMLLQLDSGKIYIDEFTSVLDRQVAKVGAGAFAKAWRRSKGRRVILITPHYDVLDWVQPDWWIDTAEGADEFAQDRQVVRARKGDFQAARHHGGYPGDKVGAVEC